MKLHLTQTELAQRIHSKQKSISRYETGASLPSIKTLVRIAKILKKTSNEVLRKTCQFRSISEVVRLF